VKLWGLNGRGAAHPVAMGSITTGKGKPFEAKETRKILLRDSGMKNPVTLSSIEYE